MCLMNIIDVYKLELMTLFYNICNTPDYRHLKMVSYKKVENEYSMRNISEYRVPIPRTKVLKSHYEYRIPLIWNTIPLNIRQQPNVTKFKKCYKFHLLDEYRNHFFA